MASCNLGFGGGLRRSQGGESSSSGYWNWSGQEDIGEFSEEKVNPSIPDRWATHQHMGIYPI